MPTLRGHHLICLHFFGGEGYDPAFIDNLKETLHAAKTEGLTIKTSSDDICRKCPYLKNGSCRYSENAEDQIRGMDRKALELLSIVPGISVTWEAVSSRIPGAFADWFRSYCIDCEWRPACEKNNYFRKMRPLNS